MNRPEIVARAFVAGACDLKRRQSLLNRINVFPVVDADTGINMCQTVGAAEAALTDGAPTDFEALAAVVPDAVLRGARGNSGVILSQFLAAFFESLGRDRAATRASFATAAENGRIAAYGSVAKPVEGTLLTAITAFADALRGLADADPDTEEMTEGDFATLEMALAKAVTDTPNRLPALKQAGVVDAGALGFYVFASGLALSLLGESGAARISRRIEGEDTAPLEGFTDTINPAFLESSHGTSDYRYCVNFLVSLDAGAPSDFAAPFETIGASVDAARSGDLLKLHVHTDHIEKAKQAAARFGEVLKVESDDMSRGLVRAMVARGDLGGSERRIRVVGDSSMSISVGTETDLGIYKVENYVNFHGTAVTGSGVDMDELLRRMRDGQSFTTAQAAPTEMRDFLSRMLAISEHVVFFAVGRAYSGTQETLRVLADAHEHAERITVLDTHAASGQQGVAAIASARFAESATGLEELAAYARAQIASAKEYLVIDDLKYLARSGRIGKVKAAFAGILSVRPIVGHGEDGAITYAKVRSNGAALDEICRRIAGHPGCGPLLVMVEHTDNPSWTAEVAARLKGELPGDAEIIEAPLSATSAVHMGPGTWGVAVTRVAPLPKGQAQGPAPTHDLENV